MTTGSKVLQCLQILDLISGAFVYYGCFFQSLYHIADAVQLLLSEPNLQAC